MRKRESADSCTTILVGKNASYDGSTIVARTEDSQNGVFTPKKLIVVKPEDQPRHYKSVLCQDCPRRGFASRKDFRRVRNL